jgi:predicted DNA-binding transcriptional regulator YafY
MRDTKLARQLQLIERLYSPLGCTVEQLAAELECSQRTVFRYLKLLEDAGFDVRLDSASCYKLAPHFISPEPPRLLGEELLALTLALTTSPLAIAPDLAMLMQQAMGKLLTKAPLDQREQVLRVLQACQVQLPEHAGATGRIGTLRTILKALANESLIQVVFLPNQGTKTILDELKPISLNVHEGQWSVVCVTSEGNSTTLPLPQIWAVRLRDEQESETEVQAQSHPENHAAGPCSPTRNHREL